MIQIVAMITMMATNCSRTRSRINRCDVLGEPPRIMLMRPSSSTIATAPMASFLSSIILPIAVAAVAIVLLLGLINMMRGGSPNRSQQLMRLRVLLQFVAIVIIMLAVWAMGR